MMEKLIVKLLAHGILITVLIVLLSNAAAGGAIFTAIGIAVVSYVLGDLMILPRTSNMVATLMDALLVFVVLWFVASASNWTLSFGDILLITVFAAAFEYFFHLWFRSERVRG